MRGFYTADAAANAGPGLVERCAASCARPGHWDFVAAIEGETTAALQSRESALST